MKSFQFLQKDRLMRGDNCHFRLFLAGNFDFKAMDSIPKTPPKVKELRPIFDFFSQNIYLHTSNEPPIGNLQGRGPFLGVLLKEINPNQLYNPKHLNIPFVNSPVILRLEDYRSMAHGFKQIFFVKNQFRVLTALLLGFAPKTLKNLNIPLVN